MMERLKYLAQSLLLPFVGGVLLTLIFLFQFLFFSDAVATVWLDASQRELASIEGRLEKSGFKVSIERIPEAGEFAPDKCDENSFRIKATGSRELDYRALMDAITDEGKDPREFCSLPFFEAVARWRHRLENDGSTRDCKCMRMARLHCWANLVAESRD